MLAQTGTSPFDLRWRMLGISVRIQPSFWLFCAFLGWPYLQRQEWAKLFTWVGCIFLSFFVKELGHVLVGRLFGVRGGIVLYAFGGSPVGDYASMKRWQRILFYAAGPAFSFALYGVAVAILKNANLALLGNWHDFGHRVIYFTKDLNLFWACLHLLPIYPLDGGMIVRELCEAALGRLGLILSLVISITLAGGIAAWAGYVLWSGRRADWPWYLGEPIFSLIFDSMLALQGVFALVKVLREHSPAGGDEHPGGDEHHDDVDRPKQRDDDFDNYRPFDGGRPYDAERR